ncbi:MAG: toxin-antitoxin system YwqK family antitoxin [Planctomycetota bacterium]|nr:toxin-antitoxin system YwqK family antitoxin [Planctomycetota bacterium]
MKVLGLALIGLGCAVLVWCALVLSSPADGRESVRAAPAGAAIEGADDRGGEPLDVGAGMLRRASQPIGSLGIPGAAELVDAANAIEETPRAASEQERPGDLVDGPELRGYYENGQLHYLGHQVRNERGQWVTEGQWESWHENGALDELGMYQNDEEHGLWKWWHRNGVQLAEGSFAGGAREGPWSYWYENGHKQMDATYQGGKAHGQWTSYHENGAVGAQGEFAHGKMTGRWTVWNPDGTSNPTGSGIYENGKKVAD